MYQTALFLLLTSACITGCGGEVEARAPDRAYDISSLPQSPLCEVINAGSALPDDVRETSGLARSARSLDRFWTHNDAGHEPLLFALDSAGRLVQSVRISGARLIDWEDLEAAACGDGDCLYIADIGDNEGAREWITIYRVMEPDEGAVETEPAVALHARFPDGPRDAEALFADRSGSLYVITKGRAEEIAVYRYPAPQHPGHTATLERVRELFPTTEHRDDRVTAAASTPDGRWVGVRTYRTLYIYAADALTGGGQTDPLVFDLAPLAEAQGESLVLADDGAVWLTSEAASKRERASWSRLHCRYRAS